MYHLQIAELKTCSRLMFDQAFTVGGGQLPRAALSPFEFNLPDWVDIKSPAETDLTDSAMLGNLGLIFATLARAASETRMTDLVPRKGGLIARFESESSVEPRMYDIKLSRNDVDNILADERPIRRAATVAHKWLKKDQNRTFV